jgi:hypothetical protein
MKVGVSVDKSVIRLADMIRLIDELTELIPEYRLDEADEIRKDLFEKLDEVIHAE